MNSYSTVSQADVFIIFSVTVSPECVTKYNELKLGKTIKYIIYRLTDDYKEIVVEESSTNDDWEVFQEKLLNAKASHKGKEGKGPRYAVYDFQYELEEGEGIRCFVPTNFPKRNADIVSETKLSLFRGRQMKGHLCL